MDLSPRDCCLCSAVFALCGFVCLQAEAADIHPFLPALSVQTRSQPLMQVLICLNNVLQVAYIWFHHPTRVLLNWTIKTTFPAPILPEHAWQDHLSCEPGDHEQPIDGRVRTTGVGFNSQENLPCERQRLLVYDNLLMCHHQTQP